MKKKFWWLVAALALSVSLLAGCGPTSALQYYDGIGEQPYNNNLFYRNDLTNIAADPSVIYVTEGEQSGWFYMYATSDDIGASGYQSWRSKDLSNWECMGVAFQPDRNSWANRSFWAPEVIYHKDAQGAGKYYMFYNAMDRYNGDTQSIGLAVSDNPQGPFVQWADTNSDGRKVSLQDVYLDFTLMPKDHPLYDDNATRPFMKPGSIKVIDASPFVDDDGQIYLYFCHDLGSGYNKSEIWGMKLKDFFTPDYSTVTRLTETNKKNVGSNVAIDTEATGNNVNEAPFMIKHDGKYYLTYSINSFTDKSYSVAQAIGTSPLGEFTKKTLAEGGIILASEQAWDHMSGTGHHSFAKAGDELFMMYHAHVDRELGNSERAIACDRVLFANNGTEDVLYANGPTWSLQPLPAVVSGYKNVATDAKISVKNMAKDSDAKFLNDGMIGIHSYGFFGETLFKEGKSTITLSFDDYKTVRALLIYNSWNYETTFVQVEKVEFEFKSVNEAGKEVKGTAVINDLKFDWDNYKMPSDTAMRPGGAALAEFDELAVKKIKITISGNIQKAVAEIVVLGK